MHKRIKDRQTKVLYERLATLVGRQKAEFEANPTEVLNTIAERCRYLERKINAVSRALNPMPTVMDDRTPIPIDMPGEILRRQDAAMEILLEPSPGVGLIKAQDYYKKK